MLLLPPSYRVWISWPSATLVLSPSSVFVVLCSVACSVKSPLHVLMDVTVTPPCPNTVINLTQDEKNKTNQQYGETPICRAGPKQPVCSLFFSGIIFQMWQKWLTMSNTTGTMMAE